MLGGKTLIQTFVRMSIALVLALLPLLLTLGAIILIYGRDAFPGTSQVADVRSFYIVIVSGLAILFTAVLFIFWLPTAVLVLAVYLGALCLYFIEITVRRIAEYPNGPLLAAGTLLGMVGAFIKAFGGG